MSCILLPSCTEQEKKVVVEEKIPVHTNELVNWSDFNEDGFKNISFPNLFSRAQVLQDSIAAVRLVIAQVERLQEEGVETDSFPTRIWNFNFHADGWMKRAQLDEYLESIRIAEHVFQYAKAPDSLGYSLPVVLTNYLYKERGYNEFAFFDQLQELEAFNRLILESKEDHTVVFKNALPTVSAKYIFLTDSNLWNVQHIDQQYNAEGINTYFYGSPLRYEQRFQLENLVEKTMHQRRTYYPTGVIQHQTFYSDGLYRKRYFNYDSAGYCSAFQDSIFGDGGDFVYTEQFTIKRSSNHLPLSVDVALINAPDTARTIKKYAFIYSYYP
jgi:hypothetical protein